MYLFPAFYNFDQQICHFFTDSQKLRISHFLSLFPKYMRYQGLLYLILKLLTKNFGLSDSNMAQGLRVLVQEDKVSLHGFLLRYNAFTLYRVK